jgi:hypothetical protein
MSETPKSKSTGNDELDQPADGENPHQARHLGLLFELEGLGREYWVGIDPDEFVRKLRGEWE